MSILCDLTSGWDDTFCRLSVGGIRRAVPIILNTVDHSTVTIVNNEITNLSSSEDAYEYILEKNLSSYEAYPVRSEESGSVFWDITLNLVFINDTKELREILTTLARNTIVWLVQKSSGEWVCLGLQDGMTLGADNEGGSGVTKADRNGYSLTFMGQEISEIPNIPQGVVSNLLASS